METPLFLRYPAQNAYLKTAMNRDRVLDTMVQDGVTFRAVGELVLWHVATMVTEPIYETINVRTGDGN